MRQTNLKLKELLDQFHSSKASHPRCFFLNEIGEICRQKEEDYQEAEKFLRQMLTSANPNYQFVSFCFLLVTPDTEEKTSQALNDFQKKSENQEMIKKAINRLRGGI